ncbi:hypothetical protein [Vibrio sp. 10N.286.46.E10]|uniref:hypothetical protein n=1 Tax=unclassified Vibrio TaxID=2614977 RepID=UPI0011B21B71|nr:hypothetical protein [Vibrio sp. 10N.286.46.E10]
MNSNYLVDIREDDNDNAMVGMCLYSPVIIVSSRELYEHELQSLTELEIDFSLRVTNQKYSDVLFLESLKVEKLMPVCVNTGRLLNLEIDIYDFQGNNFGTQARVRLFRLKSMIASSTLSSTLKYNLSNYINFLENISTYDERFISKDGFFLDEEVWNRKDETYLEMLNLNELDKVRSFYQSSVFDYYLCTNAFKERKISCLNDLFSLRNNSDLSLKLVDGYPISIKILSSFFIKAAEFKLSSNVISSSFMYAFRALEAYCDGLLVFFGRARIGDALNRQGEIFKPDTLLVNNRFISGFGGKWSEIKTQDEFSSIEPNLINELEKIKELRNNFVLTHGNVKLTKQISRASIDIISSFILAFENEINQQASKWYNISHRLDEFLSIDVFDEISYFCDEQNF